MACYIWYSGWVPNLHCTKRQGPEYGQLLMLMCPLKCYTDDCFIPLSTAVGCSRSHSGSAMPNMIDKPMMKRFRVEFKSTCCSCEIPAAATVPDNTVTHHSSLSNIRNHYYKHASLECKLPLQLFHSINQSIYYHYHCH